MKPTNCVPLSRMSLNRRQTGIMLVAALGQFIGQGLATLTGIVIPLLQLATHPELSPGMQGLLGCVSLIGIMFGTAFVGRLSDRYGYLFLFRLCPTVILACSVVAALVPGVWVLVGCLFVMGLAVGGEYSLDPDYITELMPERWRTFMVGLAKALASAGGAVVAIICYLIIRDGAAASIWPRLFWITAAISAVMVICRIPFAQSPQWLAARGRMAEARAALTRMLGPGICLDSPVNHPTPTQKQSFMQFLRTNARKMILTGLPWACEGLGVYGIGIFLPVLIMSFGLDGNSAGATPMEHIRSSVMLTFILCMVMMAGFGAGLVLVRRCNHIRMQIIGFWGSAAGLALLLAAYCMHWPAWVAIGGFVLFELFLNAGPHLITFILPAQIYPVADKGTGTGTAASIGKAGAVAGAFIIPVLLRHGGAVAVLAVSIAVMVAGALITWLAAPESSR